MRPSSYWNSHPSKYVLFDAAYRVLTSELDLSAHVGLHGSMYSSSTRSRNRFILACPTSHPSSHIARPPHTSRF